MQFEGGATATMSMIAFTADVPYYNQSVREVRIFGTKVCYLLYRIILFYWILLFVNSNITWFFPFHVTRHKWF